MSWNANKMADELELRLDRSDSFGSPGYEDFEISSILTEAQDVYVKQFISELNNRKGEGFEETEIRNQGLSALLKRGANLSVSANQTDALTNAKLFDLPLDFMYCTYEEVLTDKNMCGTTTPINANVKVKGENELNRLFRNKYQRPYCKYDEALVWRLTYSREVDGSLPSAPATNKRHQIITDGTFNVINYSINYLKNPSEIVVDRNTPANQLNCILDASTHTVIVDMAVGLMMSRVKEQRVINGQSAKDLE